MSEEGDDFITHDRRTDFGRGGFVGRRDEPGLPKNEPKALHPPCSGLLGASGDLRPVLSGIAQEAENLVLGEHPGRRADCHRYDQRAKGVPKCDVVVNGEHEEKLGLGGGGDFRISGEEAGDRDGAVQRWCGMEDSSLDCPEKLGDPRSAALAEQVLLERLRLHLAPVSG